MVIILILLVLAISAIFLFNRLVSLRSLTQEAWSGIDVQLKRRHELIPNLVATVKGYGEYEQKTLSDIITKRSNSQSSLSVQETANQETAITSSIKTIFALAEAYPDLKANQSFLKLQSSLIEVEDQLQFARRYYNGAVRNYKTALHTFPSNLIAKIASFQDLDFFEIELATEKLVPEINLN